MILIPIASIVLFIFRTLMLTLGSSINLGGTMDHHFLSDLKAHQILANLQRA
jgi:hypothetical protein